MDETTTAPQGRRVLIQTEKGRIKGWLGASAVVRTLDDLNVVSRNFITLGDPVGRSGAISTEGGPLAVAKSAALFVTELDETVPRPGNRAQAARFYRSPVKLWVADFCIQGFVHVPRGGTVMNRLNQPGHAFIALTSVSVIGPETELARPFLAVNREKILAAEEIRHEEPGDSETSDDPLVSVEFVEETE